MFLKIYFWNIQSKELCFSYKIRERNKIKKFLEKIEKILDNFWGKIEKVLDNLF